MASSTHRGTILLLLGAILLTSLFIAIRLFSHHQLILAGTPPTDQELATIPILPEDPIIGDRKAPKTVVMFEDLGCDLCAEQHAFLNQLLEMYPGKLKIIWKSLSVNSLPYPTDVAHAYAFCAAEQQLFESFVSLAFENRLVLSTETLDAISEEINLDTNTLQSCLQSPRPASYAAKNEEIAQALQIQAVPAIFVDNTQITRPRSVADWEAHLSL